MTLCAMILWFEYVCTRQRRRGKCKENIIYIFQVYFQLCSLANTVLQGSKLQSLQCLIVLTVCISQNYHNDSLVWASNTSADTECSLQMESHVDSILRLYHDEEKHVAVVSKCAEVQKFD